MATPGEMLDAMMAAQNQQQGTPSGLGQPQVVRSLNQPADQVIREIPRAVPTEAEHGAGRLFAVCAYP